MKARRNKRKCKHYFDWGMCGVKVGPIHWTAECRGAWKCNWYEECKATGKEGGEE